MNQAERDEIRARHRPWGVVDEPPVIACDYCLGQYPCDTIRLLDYAESLLSRFPEPPEHEREARMGEASLRW